MKLIIGLGNPGKKYDNTRHNIGFMILDDYLEKGRWSKNDYAEYIKADIDGSKVIFIKPTTFMNLSGNAVRYFIKYYKIDIKDILVIQDDLDLETGVAKLKVNSSSGGHNGISSIIESLATNEFLRLKIGISKPGDNDTINYVLHTFSKEDMEKISKKIPVMKQAIEDFILGTNAEELMNKYNGSLWNG